MDKQVRKLLMPVYMSRFKGIGTQCEDNCCARTYKKYTEMQDPQGKSWFDTHIKPDESTPDIPYAVLRMNERGVPFYEQRVPLPDPVGGRISFGGLRMLSLGDLSGRKHPPGEKCLF